MLLPLHLLLAGSSEARLLAMASVPVRQEKALLAQQVYPHPHLRGPQGGFESGRHHHSLPHARQATNRWESHL